MKNFATLKADSPFYHLFANGRVPIVNILVPNRAELEGSNETEVYMVDTGRCGEQVTLKICEIIAERNGADLSEVLRDVKTKGLPLRVSQTVSVETDAPFFL